MTEHQHKFAWGDPAGLRDILCNRYPEASMIFSSGEDARYPRHAGEPELIAETQKYISSFWGGQKIYDHVLITNGCMQALAAAVHAMKTEETEKLVTRNVYFPFYPKLAEINGLIRSGMAGKIYKDIWVWDYPSPMGDVNRIGFVLPHANKIFDAAYFSPIFGLTQEDIPSIPTIFSTAMCGSFGKITGLSGLRLGWLATNDFMIYQKALNYIEGTTIGCNIVGQKVMVKILEDKVRFDRFAKEGQRMIDSNRTELQRLSQIFGNQEIPSKGMFALLEADDKIKQLFEKASVLTMDGEACGFRTPSMRINLSNSNEATKAMVDAVLKHDRI